MLLTDDDLIKNKYAYSISALEASVDNLSVRYLLNYQRLDAEFCAKYILNDYCASCQEDTYICTGDVLHKQPHLKRKELQEACIKYKTFDMTH
jgi:hypothetical protein